jgi:two-component system chemotaxis response regulator CheB
MIYGMPKAAFETGCVDMVLPLDLIPRQLIELTNP